MSDYWVKLGFRWGFLFGFVIGVVLMGLTGCKHPPNTAEKVGVRIATLAQLSKLPAPLANIAFSEEFPDDMAAETDCRTWTITLAYDYAMRNPQFVLDKVLPHEYAHLMSCWYRGGMGDPDLKENGDPHDEFWRQAVKQLGGDPDYV